MIDSSRAKDSSNAKAMQGNRTIYRYVIPRLAIDSEKSTMSRASKLTLAGTTAIAMGIVFFVHYGQTAEKAVSNTPSTLPAAYLSATLDDRLSLTFI